MLLLNTDATHKKFLDWPNDLAIFCKVAYILKKISCLFSKFSAVFNL